MDIVEQLLTASDRLSERLAALPPCGDLIALDPTRYCRSAWAAYLALAARPGCVLVVGMNPGPHGMAQTGIPFTDPHTMRDLMVGGRCVTRPTSPPTHVGAWSFAGLQRFEVIKSTSAAAARLHGIDIRPPRREESAKRLWGLLREVCAPYAAAGPSADKIAEATRRVCKDVLLVNALPVCWLTPEGRNVSAEQVDKNRALGLRAIASEWLYDVLVAAQPATVVSVGKWAEDRLIPAAGRWCDAHEVWLGPGDTELVRVKHPSPLAGSEESWRAEARPVFERAVALSRAARGVLS